MNDSQFQELAPYYDDLMHEVRYRDWVTYLQSLLSQIKLNPQTVLDVACGTGNVSEILADHGYSVTGVDISKPMIDAARKKSGRVDYHVQSISDLDMGRKFDLAVSLFDSINYVTDSDTLARAFRKVWEHLNENGVFIFDVNTVHALSEHFFDQANLSGDKYPHYVWTSDYDYATRICTVDMIFEVKVGGNVKRFKEIHLQRGYALEELEQMLAEAGFEVLKMYHAYRFRKPTRSSDRVFFVAGRKRVEN